jgi:hypothetical protein
MLFKLIKLCILLNKTKTLYILSIKSLKHNINMLTSFKSKVSLLIPIACH